jgi:hypothetical protein
VHGGDRHDVGGRPGDGGGAGAGQQDHLVRVLHDALQPVLGHQHGRAEVVHQPLQHGEHLLGGARVERGGRLVQHQHLRVHGEHRADRHPLLLAAGEGGQRAVAQRGQAQQVEGLLDAPPHGVLGQAQRLHAVGEFVLDGVGDEVRERVLAHRADDIGEFARPVGAGVAPRDGDPAAQQPAGEVRHQAAHRAEQRRLADPGGADDQAQLALGNGQFDRPYGGFRGALVGDGHVLEADHRAAPPGAVGVVAPRVAVGVAVVRAGAGRPGGEAGVGAVKAGRSPSSSPAAGHSGRVGAVSGKAGGSSGCGA